MNLMKKTFERIQDNLLKNLIVYNTLHYTIVHYKGLPNQGLGKQLNAKDWLPGENFLIRQNVFSYELL